MEGKKTGVICDAHLQPHIINRTPQKAFQNRTFLFPFQLEEICICPHLVMIFLDAACDELVLLKKEK
jgi:hypothetical protein